MPFGVWFSRHSHRSVLHFFLHTLSPLPFGVWFSRHEERWLSLEEAIMCLHCLSAFGSVVTRHDPNCSIDELRVSIAFRRLVQSSHRVLFRNTGPRCTSPLPFGVWFSRHCDPASSDPPAVERRLHCLSAFGSVVTRWIWDDVGGLRDCLHCLSAFGSVVT